MKLKKIFTVLLLGICLIVTAVLVKAYMDGEFNSTDSLRIYIKSYGIFGPVILTVIQAAQVVLPILPGFLGCAVGGVMFGWFGGFLCNYIGISVGSIAAFMLAKKYGIKLVNGLFSEKRVKKYMRRIERSKKYEVFLFIAMLLPLFPDDFLCYFSGLTGMRLKKFAVIIILGKPLCILAYSIAAAQI